MCTIQFLQQKVTEKIRLIIPLSCYRLYFSESPYLSFLWIQAVNFEKDWKLVTLFIGGNDLCQYCNDRVSFLEQPSLATL